ncbi:MAG: PqqD family protein [Acholeplasmataceae bacterium]|nr:PqqD family protein [Acholeplasmataceae bacterium]
MKIKEGYILKEVAKQYIVVPVGDEAINFNGILTLNKSAKYLFEALLDDKTVAELVLLLTHKYEINEDKARQDVLEFIHILESKNILI